MALRLHVGITGNFIRQQSIDIYRILQRRNAFTAPSLTIFWEEILLVMKLFTSRLCHDKTHTLMDVFPQVSAVLGEHFVALFLRFVPQPKEGVRE